MPVWSQDEQRDRRRAGLSTVYGGEFDLVAEITAICGPLAHRVSQQHDPRAFGARVEDLVDAVHELVSTVIGWFAEIDARQRTENLSDDMGRRTAAMRLLVDLAQRPPLPDVGAGQLTSGSWATTLVEMAEPSNARLADLLGRALPPGAVALRGLESRSEKLVDLLRSVDRAALGLARQVGRAESAAATRAKTPAPPPDRAEVARAELRKLGIEAPA